MTLSPFVRRTHVVTVLAVVLTLVAAARSSAAEPATGPALVPAPAVARIGYRTELFGRRYRLDTPDGLKAYAAALDKGIERARQDEPAVEAHKGDPLHHRLPPGCVDKKERHAMQAARKVVLEAETATGSERRRLLDDLYVMAGSIRASMMRVVPGDMDAFTALARQGALRHSPVGLGKDGPATDLAGTEADLSLEDPVQPSSYWKRPAGIAGRDLYHAFDRKQLPDVSGEALTYERSKQGWGTHGGFDATCKRYGTFKLKLGKVYAQPFAQRIFWALGFNTDPVDHLANVRVKWDPRILTEYNTRRDQSFRVMLFGFIPIRTEHLQRYQDPFEPISEFIVLDDQGREVAMRPNPTWAELKRRLFKDPRGRPETREGNIDEAFSKRIRYVVYKHASAQDIDAYAPDGEKELGLWDWDGEGNPGLRENRGAAFVSAWLNQYDPRVVNTRLAMVENHGRREFRHYYYDVGICLGRADDATKMDTELPNEFPWTFTVPARAGQTAVPLDGSYHPIQHCEAFKQADIADARWAARLIAQLTGKQILEALVASGLPSAKVRLYYDKLVSRRNKAMADLGIDVPPLQPLDAGRTFDYDPLKDGLITITTRGGRTVAAPDDGWVIAAGRVVQRGQENGGPRAKERRRAGDATGTVARGG